MSRRLRPSGAPTGTIAQEYEYDSYGNITFTSNPTLKQPYTYTGREYDEETGLHFYRARYYDPAIGRFISEDPIGFAGGTVNLYEYVKNRPTRYVDPLGLGYLDLNVTVGIRGIGITVGVMFDDNGDIYPYAGVGIMNPGPGVSLNSSSDNPTPGVNVGAQAAYGIGGQGGISMSGDTYTEKGIGSPGYSMTSYYVFGPCSDK